MSARDSREDAERTFGARANGKGGMEEIYERSPTRVDLAGGTLDCWPLYLFLANPVTVNVAIDIFTHCHLTPRTTPEIELISDDLGVRRSYANLDAALADTDPNFELYRAHLRFFQPVSGFTLRTRSESPVGGGLGGSSSLCISMIKAFNRMRGTWMRTDEMVRIASHLEAQVLVKPTGTQDYFPPIFGGLCFIEYGVPGPRVETHPIPKDVFDGRFLLVYTGKSHHSGINNWQVIKNYLDGDEHTRSCMRELALVSKRMQAAILSRSWDELPGLFEEEFKARVALSVGFSSPEILRLKELASQHGAIAKICGAGGGGCVMIWCPERQAGRVRDAVAAAGFQALPALPWEEARA
ncbi:MAG: galactokinase [Bdellovibrionaceae bacterium]|nr:galactokinase [Pseudobdellovibrionaceae bacterium]